MLWKSSLNDQSFEYKLSRGIKRVYNRVRVRSDEDKKILFVIGCQRSGTSMLMRIFERDVDTKVFSEFSKLTNQDKIEGIRLNPLPSLQEDFGKERVPLMIVKPLVETQNARKLLDYFDNAKALWMYREYKDVVLSNLKLFGTDQAMSDLRDIATNNKSSWRGEYVPAETREFVLKHFTEDITPQDARALFWYARNSLFFDLELDKHPRVMMCNYKDLVSDPMTHMARMYKFLGHRMPRLRISSAVRTSSLGKGRDVEISAEIESSCRLLMEQLDAAYQADQARV